MPSISMKMEWDSLTEKKCTTSKLQVMFFSGILMRTIAWKEIALRYCSEEIRKEPGYTGIFAQYTHTHTLLNIKKSLLITHKDIQFNDFCAFLCMRRCKSLG